MARLVSKLSSNWLEAWFGEARGLVRLNSGIRPGRTRFEAGYLAQVRSSYRHLGSGIGLVFDSSAYFGGSPRDSELGWRLGSASVRGSARGSAQGSGFCSGLFGLGPARGLGRCLLGSSWLSLEHNTEDAL